MGMMDNRHKKSLWAAGMALAVVCVFLFWWLFFAAFSSKGVGTYVFIDNDDTPDSVYHKLDEAANPRQLLGIKVCGALLGYGKHVRPGRYEAGGGVGSLRLLRDLRSGRQAEVRLVVPVVHTLGDLAARLSSVLQADSTAFARTFSDTILLKDLGYTAETAPALFIPDTYEVYWNITPEQLLRRMKREHDAFWTSSRRKEAEEWGLSPDEAYTLASIVEQETANEGERPMVARMYLNRLRQGMKLQADPTVKFALHDFSLRRIMHVHLSVDSPYNTYKYEGLPAGPICIPSRNAIEAVLHPAEHDYIYMCAKEDFSGTHNFARTYEEHLANARRYAAALDRRGVK